MNILYLGDIMAEGGIRVVQALLPALRSRKAIDLVIAQAENVTHGKGMSVADYQTLRRAGVDFFTGGNHTPHIPELHSLLADPNAPVIGPANLHDCPGPGYKYIQFKGQDVLVVSLLGKIVGKDSEKPVDNPLHSIDSILESESGREKAAIIVDFHGDYSSEKVVIGHYLDGKVSAVVGDHWHVPTADARVLPKGTAHMTDVGMCGVLNSSLGVTYDSIVPRWHDGKTTPNVMEDTGPYQFSGLLITTTDTMLCAKVEHIMQIIEKLP